MGRYVRPVRRDHVQELPKTEEDARQRPPAGGSVCFGRTRMEKTIGSGSVALVEGDITQIQADALVTAANAGLQGGGGVDGAIHRAAGRRLLEACRQIGGCPTGAAVLTPAFDLEERGIRHVIHAVGPRWSGGQKGEAGLLQGAYRRSLELADHAGCQSICFPSISTGVYGYPIALAAPLALETCAAFLRAEPRHLRQVLFALFGRAPLEAFSSALAAVVP